MTSMIYEQLAGDRQRELIALADEYRRTRRARGLAPAGRRARRAALATSPRPWAALAG